MAARDIAIIFVPLVLLQGFYFVYYTKMSLSKVAHIFQDDV
jgi:hypothetical protein